MNLVCKPHCSNPDSLHGDLLVIEIPPDIATRLGQIARETRALIHRLHQEGWLTHSYGYVSLPSPIEFKVYDSGAKALEPVLDAVEEADWVRVSDPAIWQQASLIKTEHHYLMVFDRFIALNGVRKYTNETFESRTLTFELLDKIAVETATLEPTGSAQGSER